ncbi:cytochrome ubiquinol oxidase subunit I [Paenibacillus sp. SYP-B3998]|uniref:Cytochrome ubiquinol oxidase subunit I n=1 Tax=Paenibacillus sp. SYP-B3998 TaxID=2678564 RepID=A0A6G4A052_9BACL|nr:cytochrome ubiquinol oxidase subunit I [Paenibacillus sp. SYP-B3998]NEW07745.1 cytochrome ubiquinol oxidase subunit I [Paenibacillus sp. SYP-B3998]
MNYDPVQYSRMLTELTLAFHIIFATIGVGVPVMIALAEWTAIKRKDPYYSLMARRWARGFVITVAVGVVTGTAIGLQLSLLWPSFMRIAGQAVALPLFLETFAFFFEAIFLGIYLYTWDRFKKPIFHFLLLIPVVLGSSASAFFITTVNAFMNTPRGFKLQNGAIVDIQPLVAMFNPATPTKVSHVLASSYMTSAFILAAIAAFSLLKKKDTLYHRKALKLTMTAALVFSVSTALIGDLSGKFLAKYQPEKLAAAEWHFDTDKKVPLVMGGILTKDNEIKYGLKIPYALSILAHGSPTAEVQGLNETPIKERPPLYVHYIFDMMVSIGVFLTLLALLYIWAQRRARKHQGRYPRWLLRLISWSGPLAMLGIECGWVYAEVGRQPWILRGYMKTAEGATTSAHVDTMLVLFCFLYILLGLTVIKVLSKLFKNNDVQDELIASGIEGGEAK